jgi:nitroreductase
MARQRLVHFTALAAYVSTIDHRWRENLEALEALITRVSAGKLVAPAPDDAVLSQLFAAADRAPDHGRLKPWRFLVIRGEARTGLGRLMAEALARREPDAPAALLEKEQEKAFRAPMIIVVVARPIDSPKVPKIEQIVACGAAATNILVAAYALGFGGVWKTGAPAYDAGLKAGLGLVETDQIIGFLYLGTVPAPLPPAPRSTVADYVQEWRP